MVDETISNYNWASFYPTSAKFANRLGPENQPTAIFPSAPSMSPWCDSSKSVLEGKSGGGVFFGPSEILMVKHRVVDIYSNKLTSCHNIQY